MKLIEDDLKHEIFVDDTIVSVLNFNVLALSVAIAQTGNEQFGPAKDFASLGYICT